MKRKGLIGHVIGRGPLSAVPRFDQCYQWRAGLGGKAKAQEKCMRLVRGCRLRALWAVTSLALAVAPLHVSSDGVQFAKAYAGKGGITIAW